MSLVLAKRSSIWATLVAKPETEYIIVPIVTVWNRLGIVLLTSPKICLPPVSWGLSFLRKERGRGSSPSSQFWDQVLCEIRDGDERDTIHFLRIRFASNWFVLENPDPFSTTSNLDQSAYAGYNATRKTWPSFLSNYKFFINETKSSNEKI